MFMDEARFGRIAEPKRCWSPPHIRPIVPKQLIREYEYVYGAFSPLDGEMDTLILPAMFCQTMNIFLKEVSQRHPDEYILMILDGAANHRAKKLIIPDNIQLLVLPPYSPELNPSENIWDEIREKWFENCVFKNLNVVEQRLIKALKYYEIHPEIIKSITLWKWIEEAIR